jgi:hypothetical protein
MYVIMYLLPKFKKKLYEVGTRSKSRLLNQ